MPRFRNLISADIDPGNPVNEVCAVINAVMKYHPTEEQSILIDIQAAIGRRLDQLKGVEKKDGKPVREPNAE